MNISEGNDVNTLLRHVLQVGDIMGYVPDERQAREAAVRLAARANKTLGAGLTGKKVEELWLRK